MRRKLGITKGTPVKFLIHDNGTVEVKATPKEKIDAALALFDELGDLLKEEGVTLEQWMREDKETRKKLLGKRSPRN
ncbi:MAG TPA: hypothetical protein PLJ62_12870 [Thermoflexales bacterium]|nr:hypothetical protein [Thermoflexales bacterium]HRA01089.1 hypothetical protein [Thermoflexales bacterium]